ncbi:PLxRFG domain-containing protein [Vibrio parahaemolyticus]|uniref:PLxRFG domain-containing protein n=1 Tax=Vibrio parahaemolyticus TaxID=670 RepID=UPI000695B953|nr:PLxRFG domain-containing protein [Vibrio parahaemolyticus]EGQ8311324.1 PLxRFG domain-containing protein [Vibrio parahaemolyticus]EGR1220004.1 SAM-dependent methyltransferase [Vibrio parahaemolyticus]EHK5109214.1 PLxRFG domain-containing protein [Vibrio parahaemolyticus]EID7776182.1 PLxRFG domain-containing protein [Vibrio parahaemolyticus]EII2405481.1 PLxRFG domain-containing protein [Vibrio parahaemolyticus]
MDFIEARRRVAERERNRNTSTFGDVVDMAQQGALQTLAGAANFVGAEKAASSLENWANEQYETLSPEMREAMAKDIINDDMSFGEGAKDWRTWLGTASNVLGGMAVTMLPAGAAGKAASMAGRSAAVSQGANVGTNALLNLAAGNGGQALNVQREIENIPYHELMDSPQFKRYVAEEADKNISDEEALNNARTRLAQEVGDSIKTDLTLGMVNLIGETVGDQAMVKLLKGSLGKTIKGAIGKGVLAEGGTEAVQGGVEQYRSNVHTNEKMDVEGDNSEGVGAAALESGLVGGLIGGGFGAPSGVAGHYRRRNFETKIEQAINPEVISQLRSVGKTDQEIEALLRPKIENRALSMGFDANESTALAHQALGAAMGKVPPAAERHATEDQAEAQQSVEPQQPEPVQPQQAQPQQPISEAAKQQEQAPVNLFSSDNHADLIRDGQQAVSAIKTWEKQDRGNDYAKQLRQDMSRYLATLNTDLSIEERQAAQRSMNSIYNEFLNAIGQKQKSPVDVEVAQAEMFDPETGEVMADSELYHSQDAQRDKFELSQSIQRGELGFVDEIAAQDENFKQGLQRAMEISPAAVLQIAKARRDGSMSQDQAISALQRVINSEELKQVDQLRPTDEESFLRDQQAQDRNAQQQLENRGIRTNGYQPNVEETPEFQRNQARVLQGMRQQAQTNSFAGGHQPNGERDVTPLATGIENQRVYDAPQVEHTLKTKELNQSVAKERFAKAKTGKADNPRYQAYLDTLESEELEAINSNAGYMSWITHRIADFRDENGMKKSADLTSSQHKEFDKYLREYADRHLSDRVKSERQKAIDLTKSDLSDDKPEPTQPKASKDTSNETDASKSKKGRSRPSGAREYLKAINALQSGEYTKEEAIELIDNYIDDVPALEEEFSQFTKPAIGNFFAQMGQWIDTSLRKDDLVKRAVKDIGNQFAAIQSDGGMFVVKSPSAMRNILSEMSDADYNKLAEKRKQQAIEREQEAERKKKALDNPQTLDDFQAYARANGGTIDAFNDQQLAEFDRLYTENQLSKLAEQEKRELERKAEVKAVETDGTIELSKVDVLNEAKGEQRYGAAFSEVDSDTFNDMRAKAKQLGGWYARAYKPKNLPARFDFKSEQARDDFLSVMGGLNVDQSERVKQRDQEKTKSKKEKQVEALREKAASLQAKADESNNTQRLTNTSRRAAMAASAAARADKQEAQANILRKIADGVESGEFLLLGNLTDISQLEELTSVMNRVKWDMPEDVREKLAYRDQQGNWHLKPETKFNQVARYVRFPAPKSTPASLEYIAREIENLDGYKMTAKSIRANIKGLKEHESVNLNGARWDKVIPKLRQLARSKSNTVYRVEHINELFKSQDRLIRMGIKGDITLRQALREYEQANNGKMSTQKEKTRLQKLTEKIEETVRGNRNAFNDFFPTPEAEVKKLIDLADIKPGMKVLEPSAGMGHIADQIAALNGVDLDVGELAFTLSELLEEKGHNVVAGDFLEYNAGEIYDRIVMNPPFSNDADIHHINHALTMLKDGGKLVAITSSMAGNRGNTTNKNFRRYLDEVGAEEINLDAGAFKNSLNPTNVATKIIVIEKPANDQYDDIRFSKASEVNKKPSTSLSPEKVTQAAQDWINQYDGLKGANVMVVPTMADLHELVETESNAIVKGAWLSGDNRVVLVAENLENVADVRRTLRHEFIAHNGLYANLDVAQQAQLTKKVNSLRNVDSLKGIFAEVDKSYRTAPEDVKAEEVIAKIAETESSVSQRILDKVLSWVLGALRRSGILSAEKITLSEVRNMINNVDSDLRKPNGMTTLSNVVRFSQTISSMDEDLAQQGDPIVSIADALAAKNESFYKQMLGKINVPFISKQFDALKNGGWALLNLRQMAEVGRKRVSREVGNILESYVNNKDLFTTRKTDLIEKVHKQADALNKFRNDKPQDAEATFSLLHDATLADVDPSKEYVDQTDEKKALLKTLANLYQEYGGSQTKRGSEIWQERQALEREIKNEPKLRLKHKALREKFLQLSPDAQKVFTDVRDHYISQREEMDKALEERITDLAMAGNKRAGENTYHRYMMEKSRLGFYVPLARFGNYWIDAVDPSGERVFQMYETENAMMKDVKKLQAAGYKVQDDKNANLEVGQVRFGLKIQESRGLNGASASFVSDIIKAISGAQTNDKVKDQLTDEIYQMYLQTMPDRSIRKSFIHRKGVAGYSEDAARVLADQGVRQANQQARLETEKRFTDLMEELKIATDKSNNVSASRLYNEMVKRHEWMMNPQRAQWAQALTGFGFFWQIGISPASAMINLSQNWQIALPYIGSRFGFKETAAEMASLSGLFAKTFVAKKSKAGLRGDMDMTNGILGDVLNQEEREALRHAIKIGAIDVTQMADLTGMAEQESSNYTGKWAKAQQLIGAPFHWAEVMNREVCFITAYRMAKRNGLSKQESLDYATKATWDSHFDYSSRNRARFMQGDVAAVALQFKQYSQNMTYYLFSRFFDSIKGETPEVRKEARKQLLGTFAVTFAIGGLNALPVATIAAIANMAYAVAGDDNEPWDAETELKSLLAKTFGEDIAKGLYYGSMPSVSSRINIDLLRLWVQESDAQDSVGVAENILQQAAGASFGIAVSWARGLDYMTEGQYLRGVEYMTPKWIKDVFRTARYASEGGTVTNRNGEIIIDDVTLFEHAQQALGFTPARLVQQYDSNSALKGYERQVTRRRQSLMNAYWLAVRTKDNDGRKSVLNNIREFNRSEWGRQNPITNEVLSRSVKQHFKMASKSQNGAHYNQKYIKLLQEQQSW